MEIDKEAIKKAAFQKLETSMKPHRKAFKAISDPVYKIHKERVTVARKARQKIAEDAWEIYRKEVALANEALLLIVRPARAVFKAHYKTASEACQREIFWYD